jgi:hypothetical protein
LMACSSRSTAEGSKRGSMNMCANRSSAPYRAGASPLVLKGDDVSPLAIMSK